MAPLRFIGLPTRSSEFNVTSLSYGEKAWIAGKFGEKIALVDHLTYATSLRYQREVSIVGDVLCGECLAFEVHKVDYSSAAVQKLLREEDPNTPSKSGEESCEEVDKSKPIGMVKAARAFDLAPRRSIRINFNDILRINVSGDLLTLTLSQPPVCFAKRSGKPRSEGLQPVQDFTGEAQSIVVQCKRPAELRNFIMKYTPHLVALARNLDVPTPSRKRTRDVAHGYSETKVPRTRSSMYDQGESAEQKGA